MGKGTALSARAKARRFGGASAAFSRTDVGCRRECRTAGISTYERMGRGRGGGGRAARRFEMKYATLGCSKACFWDAPHKASCEARLGGGR